MAMVTCGECGREISSQAKACPNCGAKMGRAGIWPWMLLFFAGVCGIFVVLGMREDASEYGQMRKQERAEIARCWNEFQQRSLSPMTRMAVASVCEKMEAEFREKHRSNP